MQPGSRFPHFVASRSRPYPRLPTVRPSTRRPEPEPTLNTQTLSQRFAAITFALLVGAGLPLATAVLMDRTASPTAQMDAVTVTAPRIAG